MIVLEPRSSRTTFFDILNDIDTGELLEIAAHDTFVVTQLVSERSKPRLGPSELRVSYDAFV